MQEHLAYSSQAKAFEILLWKSFGITVERNSWSELPPVDAGLATAVANGGRNNDFRCGARSAGDFRNIAAVHHQLTERECELA